MSDEKQMCNLVKPPFPNYPYNLCTTHGRFIADNLESCPGPVIATPEKWCLHSPEDSCDGDCMGAKT